MRAFWKGPYIDLTLVKKSFKHGDDKSKVLILRSRRSTILPKFDNFGCKIYNGNKYVWLNVKLHHIGFKFGDFILTKKKCRPKTKKTEIKQKKTK